MIQSKQDQNKNKCIEMMNKIKRFLENNNYAFIMTSDKENILLKMGIYKNIKSSTVSHTCPALTNGVTNCPYTACKYPNYTCSSHSHSGSNNNNNVSDKSDFGLIRFMINDLHTGIFMHVIQLHGEESDLKMSFDYDYNIDEITSIIKFLQ